MYVISGALFSCPDTGTSHSGRPAIFDGIHFNRTRFQSDHQPRQPIVSSMCIVVPCKRMRNNAPSMNDESIESSKARREVEAVI